MCYLVVPHDTPIGLFFQVLWSDPVDGDILIDELPDQQTANDMVDALVHGKPLPAQATVDKETLEAVSMKY